MRDNLDNQSECGELRVSDPRSKIELIAAIENRGAEVGLPFADLDKLEVDRLRQILANLDDEIWVAQQRERFTLTCEIEECANKLNLPCDRRELQRGTIDELKTMLAEYRADMRACGIAQDDVVETSAGADASTITSYTKIDNIAAHRIGLTYGARGLYYTLCSMCNWPKATCWPSTAYLAKQGGCSKSSVVKWRDELIEAGLIAYTIGKGRMSNKYEITNRKALVEFDKQMRDQKIQQRIAIKKRR